jgi:HSP20 family protein
MKEFNTRPIEEKLNRFGKEIQSFFENIVSNDDIDGFNPRADVAETAEGLEIVLDLPGMTKEMVKIELANGTIAVKGQREIIESDDHVDWLRRERQYGRFTRTFPVGERVTKSDIKATFKDGVLVLAVRSTEHTDNTTSIHID